MGRAAAAHRLAAEVERSGSHGHAAAVVRHAAAGEGDSARAAGVGGADGDAAGAGAAGRRSKGDKHLAAAAGIEGSGKWSHATVVLLAVVAAHGDAVDGGRSAGAVGQGDGL